MQSTEQAQSTGSKDPNAGRGATPPRPPRPVQAVEDERKGHGAGAKEEAAPIEGARPAEEGGGLGGSGGGHGGGGTVTYRVFALSGQAWPIRAAEGCTAGELLRLLAEQHGAPAHARLHTAEGPRPAGERLSSGDAFTLVVGNRDVYVDTFDPTLHGSAMTFRRDLRGRHVVSIPHRHERRVEGMALAGPWLGPGEAGTMRVQLTVSGSSNWSAQVGVVSSLSEAELRASGTARRETRLVPLTDRSFWDGVATLGSAQTWTYFWDGGCGWCLHDGEQGIYRRGRTQPRTLEVALDARRELTYTWGWGTHVVVQRMSFPLPVDGELAFVVGLSGWSAGMEVTLLEPFSPDRED